MMFRFRVRPLCALIVSIVSCAAVSNLRAADPADGVPASASIAIRLKAPKATFEKLGRYADAVQPGIGAIVQAGLPAIGGLVKNPSLQGVDVENDWWLIVFAEAGEAPSLVYVIPTTDAEALEKAIPDDLEFHKSGTLALYSDDEDALGKVREQLAGTGTSIWASVDAGAKQLFDSSDLSVLFNVSQLAKEYDEELDSAEPRLNAFFEQLDQAIPDSRRTQLVASFDLYRAMARAGVQAIRESQSYTLGLVIAKDALRLGSVLKVQADSATSAFLAKQGTNDLGLMGHLPADQSVYVAAKGDMKSLVAWSSKMNPATVGMTEEQKAEFAAAMKKLSDLDYGVFAGYLQLESTSGDAIRSGSISEMTPTDIVREVSRSLGKSMSKIDNPDFSQTMTIEPAAIKIGGADVDRITVKQEFKVNNGPGEMQNKVLEVLFGTKGMQQMALYQPKQVLQTLGGGTKEMEKLAAAAATADKSSVTSITRKRFFERANLITLGDLPRLALNGAKLAIQAKIAPDVSKKLDGLKLTPSFVGFALSCEPDVLKTQFEIPVEQARGIAQIVTIFLAGGR